MAILTRQKIAALKKAGIQKPVRAALAAKAAGLPLSLVCAILMQETAGGRTVWGHDPTIFIGGVQVLPNGKKRNWGEYVTKEAYLAYKKVRGPYGRGGMQGVGDMQLTYYSLQDAADRIGGCYNPLPNMIVGCRELAAHIKRYGYRAGIAAYNGSGPAADRYADQVIAKRAQFIKILGK